MKLFLTSLAIIICAFGSMARAQQAPVAITYSVVSTTSDSATVTWLIDVQVTNQGTGVMNNVSLGLHLPGSSGGIIQGNVIFDAIAEGEVQARVGSFSAPKTYEGTTLDLWVVNYVDPQGNAQTEYISGGVS